VRYFVVFWLVAASAPAAFVAATPASKIGLGHTWKNLAANQTFEAKEAAQ